MNDNSGRAIEIFTEASRLSVEERAAFLDRACADDEGLRTKIDALLKVNERAGDFLERPASASIGEERSKVVAGEKPGDQIDRYRLLRQIGEGGWGVVFVAEQQTPVLRQVALKVVKPGMDTKSVIARFEAERQALALMDHPNIARVFDAGATESGRPYFVMELVEGVKITEYCDRHFLPIGARLRLFIQICAAIQHAHQKGIIHRDIKPSNILVTTAPEGKPVPKVIDFGIAKATAGQPLTDKTLFTTREMLIGTPAYMSPEQAAMTNADVDTRTDIYSLGVLLYELLTGSTPFNSAQLLKSGLDEMRRTIREQEPARPSSRLSRLVETDLTIVALCRQSEPPKLIRAVSGDLDWIVMKAMEKEPGRRYETANGLSLDAQRYLANEAVSARPPSRLYLLQKSVQRHKLLFAGISIIALLVVSGLLVVSLSLARERQSRRAAASALLLAKNDEARAKTDEAKAENEAAKSQQITKFLEDMLRGVGPSVALGRDTTMLKEILDRTAKRVDNDLTNRPEVEVELSGLIGQVYYELGDYTQAERMQRSALEISRKVFGAESKESAAALNELGLTDWREGKQAEAETNDLQALAIWRQLDGDESPKVAISLDNLADVYRHYSRPKEAEPLARQALAINQKLFGKDSLEAADSLRILCILMGDEDRWTESEALGREVLAIRIKRLKPNDPSVAASLTDVGWAASGMGKWDEAESLESQALALRQKILGNEHPEVADSFSRLGNYLQKSGDLDQAYADLNSALAIRRKILKQDDPTLIYNLRCLGSVLEDQGKLAEAEEMYQEALNSWIKRNDDPNQMLGELQNVVRVLIKEQKLGDANQLLNKMLSPEIVRPSTAAPLLFQRATIEARQNLWQKAADDALLAFKHDPWNSSQYSMVAGLLIKSHNTNAYDLLRKRLLADNARTTDMFTADQVAKSCLFLPPPESDLKAIIRLADMAVTRGIHDKGAMPFFEVCKALAEYRVGHFSEAAKWAQKSIDSPREDAHPHAYGVLALAEWRLENTEQAREALAVDEKLAPREMPTAVAHDPGTAWLSWLFARIQLTEAESLMNHSTPAVNESNPQ